MKTMPEKAIPCLDLGRQHQQIRGELLEAFSKVLDVTAFSGGSFVERFEGQLAEMCGTPHAVALNSGTSALHLAMLSLGIGPGDEVIVPANTFVATAWGVSYSGATPVFVDCTSDTWQIDVVAAEKAITPRTKAIIGVHLYGQPCDVDAVLGLCQSRNLHFVEDAAQAQAAIYKGKPIGSMGELACFSFYPGKNLGACGEAGAVVTHSQEHRDRIRRLRNHGSDVRYYHDELGYNMRMGGLEAASLSVKCQYLPKWTARRQEIAQRYLRELSNPLVTCQKQLPQVESVFHLFVIQTPDRERMSAYLKDHNIHPAYHYPVPCHLQKAYGHLGYKVGDCPNAEKLASHCLSLPMFPELTDDEVAYVIEVVNQYS